MRGSELFLTNGTFRAPVAQLYISGTGAGGAGGGTSSTDGYGGGGGGSGEWCENYPLTVTPGEILTIALGAGGTGVAGANGNDGGDTTITGSVSGLILTLHGGKGAKSGATAWGPGGNGGGGLGGTGGSSVSGTAGRVQGPAGGGSGGGPGTASSSANVRAASCRFYNGEISGGTYTYGGGGGAAGAYGPGGVLISASLDRIWVSPNGQVVMFRTRGTNTGGIYFSEDAGLSFGRRADVLNNNAATKGFIGSYNNGQVISFYTGSDFRSTNYGQAITLNPGVSSANWMSRTTAAALLAGGSSNYAYSSNSFGDSWTRLDNSGPRNCKEIVGSGDGTIIAFTAAYSTTAGFIFVSTDSGASFAQKAASRQWNSICASDSGTFMAAAVGNNSTAGFIYTSSDTGDTWVQSGDSPSKVWTKVICSANGNTLAALCGTDNIYVSTNGGTNWIARASSLAWVDVACSSDGTIMWATETTNQRIWKSTDSGATWAMWGGNTTNRGTGAGGAGINRTTGDPNAGLNGDSGRLEIRW